jgi:2-polyprenyl-3-methyl-5-hydroxy-6-metoxy-1,4-benzoquinol methylase
VDDATAARPKRPSSLEGADGWDSHWDSFGAAAEDNPANRYRHRLIFDRLGAVRPGDRLLDIGSGQGEFALLAATLHPQAIVRGIEYSLSGVDRARQRARRLQVAVSFEQRDLLADGELHEGERAWADLAVCSEVLEHVDDPATLLRHAVDYLRPGSRIVVTVPGGPRSAFDRHIGHRRHFDAGRLCRLLAEVGLTEIEVEKAGFPFFNLYRLAVILRGRALIADLSRPAPAFQHERPGKSLEHRAVKLFDQLFRFNLDDSPFGWQLVATATVRGWLAPDARMEGRHS